MILLTCEATKPVAVYSPVVERDTEAALLPFLMRAFSSGWQEEAFGWIILCIADEVTNRDVYISKWRCTCLVHSRRICGGDLYDLIEERGVGGRRTQWTSGVEYFEPEIETKRRRT